MKNKNVTYGLIAALIIALIVIAFLLYTKKDKKAEKIQPPPPPQESAPPQRPKSILALFHADWCDNCKNMMGDWQQAAKALVESGEFEVFALEAGKHAEEINKHNIAGFPDIRLYNQGFHHEAPFVAYNGDRSANSIIAFARSGGKQS